MAPLPMRRKIEGILIRCGMWSSCGEKEATATITTWRRILALLPPLFHECLSDEEVLARLAFAILFSLKLRMTYTCEIR